MHKYEIFGYLRSKRFLLRIPKITRLYSVKNEGKIVQKKEKVKEKTHHKINI